MTVKLLAVYTRFFCAEETRARGATKVDLATLLAKSRFVSIAFDNLIATYHTAGITHDSRNNMASWNAQQVAGILRGEHPPRLVNPEVWERYMRRFERIFGFRPGS